MPDLRKRAKRSDAGKTRRKNLAEKEGEPLLQRAMKYTLDSVAAMSGVSRPTLVRFRKGERLRDDTVGRIRAGVERLEAGERPRGSSVWQQGGRIAIESAQPWEGTTTVKDVGRDRMCGWCGGRHEGSFKCQNQ